MLQDLLRACVSSSVFAGILQKLAVQDTTPTFIEFRLRRQLPFTPCAPTNQPIEINSLVNQILRLLHPELYVMRTPNLATSPVCLGRPFLWFSPTIPRRLLFEPALGSNTLKRRFAIPQQTNHLK